MILSPSISRFGPSSILQAWLALSSLTRKIFTPNGLAEPTDPSHLSWALATTRSRWMKKRASISKISRQSTFSEIDLFQGNRSQQVVKASQRLMISSAFDRNLSLNRHRRPSVVVVVRKGRWTRMAQQLFNPAVGPAERKLLSKKSQSRRLP